MKPMQNPVCVWLIRHGETEWNRRMVWQGQMDLPLSPEGVAQAYDLAERFRDVPLGRVVSSDLLRARQTAEILAEPHRLPVYATPDLREVNVGRAEGLTTREVMECFGEEPVKLWRDPRLLDNGFPGGELKREALERARRVIEHEASQLPRGDLGVVFHGLIMRVLLHSWFPEIDGPLMIPNCGYLSVWFDAERDLWIPGEGLDRFLVSPAEVGA